MPSHYSKKDYEKAASTLESIVDTVVQLSDWNKNICSSDDYFSDTSGMQLLAANCTLITAIGEGINRINRILPGFLQSRFPHIPWHAIVGMRNHIAHGYFDLDADIVYEAVKNDIPSLLTTLYKALEICRNQD